MGVELHRFAMMMSAEKRGWSTTTGAHVALAVHPLDDQPIPSRQFEKIVRKRAKQTAKAVKRASDEEAAELANSALIFYQLLAIQIHEPYYTERYKKTLGWETAANDDAPSESTE